MQSLELGGGVEGEGPLGFLENYFDGFELNSFEQRTVVQNLFVKRANIEDNKSSPPNLDKKKEKSGQNCQL
jgi:hypothetical protein